MNDKLYKKIKTEIQNCNFDNVNYLDNRHIVTKVVTDLAMNDEDIRAYLYLYHTIEKHKHEWDDITISRLHVQTSHILYINFCYVEGCYALAYFHYYQAVLLDPTNIEYKEGFLNLFYDRPEKKIEYELGLQIANDILALDPHNSVAATYIRTKGKSTQEEST